MYAPQFCLRLLGQSRAFPPRRVGVEEAHEGVGAAPAPVGRPSCMGVHVCGHGVVVILVRIDFVLEYQLLVLVFYGTLVMKKEEKSSQDGMLFPLSFRVFHGILEWAGSR